MKDDPWNPELVTKRLVLAPMVSSDADELVEVLKDPQLYLFTENGPPKLGQLVERIERWAPRRSPDGKQRWLNWTIRDASTGAALGTLQATTTELAASVGWIMGVVAQGRGYASEAARALVTFLDSMGIREVKAHIHPDHEASARVAIAIGMQPTERSVDGERVWRIRFSSRTGDAP